MKKLYLVIFNLLSALGWAYVLLQVFSHVVQGKTPKEFFDAQGATLILVQSLALLEVVHAAIGLVPSPLLPTLMQVSSRLLLVWGVLSWSDEARSSYSLYLMAGSWALVEVPRYLFYAANLVVPKVPYPLFWLRYSLFAVLYPSGITGEIFQILSCMQTLKSVNLLGWYFFATALALYVPGSPFMYFHMVAQRSRQLKLRLNPPPKPKIDGIEFPEDPKTKERSTTGPNKGAFQAAANVLDPKEGENIKRERDWRHKYTKHIVKNVELSAKNPTACLKAAQAGLDYLHETFDFVRDGKTMKLSEAMKTFTGSFETGLISGEKKREAKVTYNVPYKNYRTGVTKQLSEKELIDQLKKWVEYGTIEKEAMDAIAAVVEHPEWLDLSDTYFVLLGAGSAMGPLLVLLSLGANIIAIDINRAPVWERLIREAKNSPGKMYFPLDKPQSSITSDKELNESAGCNLFTQTPEIANWLKTVVPDKPLVVGGYAYLDGALHVKVALAMDVIMKSVCETRKEVTLAFLCTPTDVHLMTESAFNESQKNYRSAPTWQKLCENLPVIGLVPNKVNPVDADGVKLYPVDALVVEQGPNYALAKRMQHWRAMVARENGFSVSSNVAPSTATASVVHNPLFAAAYGGMHLFKPMEVFYQETSNAVMGALLIHDIRNPNGVASPKTKLQSPLQLFSYGSFHGGVWRGAYKFTTIGTFSAMAHYSKVYGVYAASAVVAFAGLVVGLGLPHNWF